MQSVLFLLFLFAVTGRARVSLKVNSDKRRVIDLGTFGFSNRGEITLTVYDVSLLDKVQSMSKDDKIGFVVDAVPSATAARVQKTYSSKEGARARLCFIDDPQLVPIEGDTARHLFPLNKLSLASLRMGRPLVFFSNVSYPGLYAIFFYNCLGYGKSAQSLNVPDDTKKSSLPLPEPSPVSFHVSFRLLNYDGHGRPTYLEVGDWPLPAIFVLFGILFLGLSLLWMIVLYRSFSFVRMIHYCMLLLSVVKTASLFFESAKYISFSKTGTLSAWGVVYYIVITIKGIGLFSALILLGTGWSVFKSFLTDRDRRLLIVLLPCQVIINILLAVIEETSEGNRSWQLSVDLLQILDLVCCFCILLPLIWSMRTLKEATNMDDKAEKALSQISLFRNYYLVVVAYIYSTRILVVLIESFLSYDTTWVTKVLRELIAVIFYSYSGYTFRPHPAGAYMPAQSEDNEELKSRQELRVQQA